MPHCSSYPLTSMPMPPDRAHILAESRNPRSRHLQRLDVDALVALIQDEDRSLAETMAGARASLTAFIRSAEARFCAGGRLIYLGAGTSGRLGVLDASEAPPTFNIPPGRVVGIIAGGDSALRRSSEGREDEVDGAAAALDELSLSAQDTVLGIAAGGTTPYVRGALVRAKRISPQVLTGLLTCSPVPGTPEIDHLIVLMTGAEVLTGSTRMKAGTATKLALNTISTTLMVRLGKVYDNLMVDVRATNDKLRDRAARIISDLTGVSRPMALELLAAADGEAKVAIVMQRLQLGSDQARERLSASAGRLDRALGEAAP
jgi:N-acetylmuramic acid 6-phosphate etherase